MYSIHRNKLLAVKQTKLVLGDFDWQSRRILVKLLKVLRGMGLSQLLAQERLLIGNLLNWKHGKWSVSARGRRNVDAVTTTAARAAGSSGN